MAATRQGSRRGLRRALGWIAAAVCVVVGGLAGFLYYSSQAPVYSSDATVLVLPTVGGLDSSVDSTKVSTNVEIETEAEVAHSAQVAAAAAKSLEGDVTPEHLLANSTVTVTPNSQILTVTFEAGKARTAQSGAQAIAESYLTMRSDAAKTAIGTAKQTLEAQRADLTKQFEAANKDLASKIGANDKAGTLRLQSEIQLLVNQIDDVNSRLVALQVKTTEGGQIISAASLPAKPTSPVLMVDVLAGMLLGLLAGSGILLLLSRNSAGPAVVASPTAPVAPARVEPVVPPVPEPAHVVIAEPTEAGSDEPAHVSADAASGLQVLASLELSESGTVAEPEAKALRGLAQAVLARGDQRGPLVLVGVDYPALMVAAAFAVNDAWIAELGGNALVLTEPGSPALPGRPSYDARGLTDVLSGEWPALDTVSPIPGVRSAVLGHGLEAGDLPAATQKRRLQQLWSDLDGAYGSAIAQVQVPFDGTLAQSVMQTAGPVLLVVKVGLTQNQDLAYAIEQLSWLGLSDHVVGIVSVCSGEVGHGGS